MSERNRERALVEESPGAPATGVSWGNGGWSEWEEAPPPVAVAVCEPALPERLLAEAARRAMRHPAGRMALGLHLSRLPALRPFHRQALRAILEDTAARAEGQVFRLSGGDLVLLCRAPHPAEAGDPAFAPSFAGTNPQALPAILTQLLRTAVSGLASEGAGASPGTALAGDTASAGGVPADIMSVWHLETQARALRDYAAGQLAAVAQDVPPVVPATPAPGGAPDAQTATAGAVVALAETMPPAQLLRRQTAVLLAARSGGAPEADGEVARAVQPLLRELICQVEELEACLGAAGEASSDPYLRRHIVARLDRRVLGVLAEALEQGGPLDLAAAGPLPLHLNLALPTLLSEAFGALMDVARTAGAQLGVEVSWIEAVSDPVAFARVRRRLAEAAVPLVLDAISPLALVLSRPWHLLEPILPTDLFKLFWSPRLADPPAGEGPVLAAALERLGPQRVVLLGTDGEDALRWGLARGIRRFQGRHADRLLAATRMAGCPRLGTPSGLCPLRVCVAQAARVGAARVEGAGAGGGCIAPVLLDDGSTLSGAGRERAA